jgi:Na+/proline symporter
MESFALSVGYIAIVFFCLIACVWAASHSPLIAWLLTVGGLLLWGLGSLGAVFFLIFAIHVPNADFWGAFYTVTAGAVLYIPWFIFGIPGLKENLEKENRPHAIWE